MINRFTRQRKPATPICVPDPGVLPPRPPTPALDPITQRILDELARGQRSQVPPPDMARLIQQTRSINAGWTLPRDRA